MFCAGYSDGKIDACQVAAVLTLGFPAKNLSLLTDCERITPFCDCERITPGRQWGSGCVERGREAVLHTDWFELFTFLLFYFLLFSFFALLECKIISKIFVRSDA